MSRKYVKFPDVAIEELRIRRQNGETVTDIARSIRMDRGHLSRVLRGKFRAGAGGPIAPNGSPVPVTAEERAQILQFVLENRRHSDAPPSMRALSEKIGRDRFNMVVKATTKRAVELTERLFNYIDKGDDPNDCWIWTGSIATRPVTLADGTETIYRILRLMDGPAKALNPRRMVFEFCTGRTLTDAQHLASCPKNDLCVNFRHCTVMGE